jgi:methionyl aminopeptidase
MIVYKTEEEIRAMRRSSRMVAQILAELAPLVAPGVTTRDLDAHAERRTREMGAVPAFKGYRGFPAALCASVNEEIVHGIPSERVLREGDIVSLDYGVLSEGFYGDATVTLPVGEIDPAAARLIAAARESFLAGVAAMKEGGRVSDISAAVQKRVEADGFSVIRAFVGHGIGRSLHEEPQVPNFGLPGHGPRIRPGLVLAIEPMIAMGDWEVEILRNGWTAVTKDRSLAAHHEHTVACTASGIEILSAGDAAYAGNALDKESLHA